MDCPGFRLPLALGCALTCLLAPAGVHAQAPVRPVTPAEAFDPSDVWFQAWMSSRDAEKLAAQGKFSEALAKYEHSRQMFENVAKLYPDWKKDMVDGRLAATRETIAALQPKAAAEPAAQQGNVADFEGGGRPLPAPEPKTPGQLRAAEIRAGNLDHTAERQRIAELERQIASLKEATRKGDEKLASQLRAANAELQAARAKPQADPAERRRIAELERQMRDIEDKTRRENLTLSQQLNQTNAELEAARVQMAKAPAQSELDRLNKQVAELEGQRQAMALALRQSRGEFTEAQARIATLEADIANARQAAATIERNLNTERDVSNQVSRGLQKQLAELNTALAAKAGELTAAQQTIAGLNSELDETRAAFLALQDERNTLLRDKEQMSALLNLNDAGRIKELIEQNMTLAKQLREADERFKIVQGENDSNKEAYVNALRDLGIAKSNILNLRKENRDQQARLDDLEKSLRDARTDLANNPGNPEENEVLKNVIRTQLLQQVRRREARQVLLTHAKRLGADEPAFKEALQVLEDDELKLTPEEQKAIAMEQADGEFISPVARPQRQGAASELHQTVNNYRKAAEKAFTAGRYKASEEVLRLILEEHPMHSPTLNSLGVVMLRQDQNEEAAQVFRDAVMMNAANPFAHRMLGFALYRMNNLAEAETELRAAIDLNPADANAHVLLGNLAFRLGRASEAENHFKAAIAADPTLSEPYYNLAFLAAGNGHKQEARTFYQTALENGALPDPELEKRIGEEP
jgi:Flp pilus assembly protein TadD/peptidoglycan hydrolase CwlO-like protein